MRSGLGDLACVPLVVCVFDLAAFAGALMLFCVMLFPLTEAVAFCLGKCFCLGFTAFGTCVGLDTGRYVRSGLGDLACVPVMIRIYDVAASAGFFVLLIVMLGPCTVCVVCGLFDLLGLLFIANSTCIGLFTLCQVCRGCSNDTVIPLVSFVRSLAASGAGVLMLFCIVLFPCTKGMIADNGNRCICRCKGNIRRYPACVNILQGIAASNGLCTCCCFCLQSELENIRVRQVHR